MSFLPSQDNYTQPYPGSTTFTPADQFAPSNVSSGSFNPLDMVTSARAIGNTLVNKFVLKPAQAAGIGGFVFDYEGETQIVVQSEITDHYSEQNTFVNDQAAQKPQRFTLRGYIGELVDNPNTGIVGAINVLQSKLTQLQSSLGKYSPGALQKIQAAATSATTVVNKVNSAIGRAQNVVGIMASTASIFGFSQNSQLTRQQKAYQQLYAMWASNTVFTLNCPYGYFKSVMIEHMMFIQPEETKDWSEISVTVKEMRFINTTPANPGLSPQLAQQTVAGRGQYPAQAPTNQGPVQGQGFDISAIWGTRKQTFAGPVPVAS